MFKIINYLAYSLVIFLVVYLTTGKFKTVVNNLFFTNNAAVYWVAAMDEGDALALSLKSFDKQTVLLPSLVVQYSKLNELFYEGSLQREVDWAAAFFEPKVLSRDRWLKDLDTIIRFNFLLLESAQKNNHEDDILFYQERLLDTSLLLIQSAGLYSRLLGQATLKRLLINGVNEIFYPKMHALDVSYFDVITMLAESKLAFEADTTVVVNQVYRIFQSLEDEDIQLLQKNMYRQANVIEKEFFVLLTKYVQTDNKGYINRFNLLKKQLVMRTQAKNPVYSHTELLERYKDEFLYFVSRKERRQYSFLSFKIMSDYMRTFLQFDYLTFIDTVKFNQKRIVEINRFAESEYLDEL